VTSHPQSGTSSKLPFEQIVREHQEMVFRTLQRLTGSPDRVEDLAQEVFLRLYRGLPHFQGDAKLSTYLYRILLNVAQDEWKRRRRDRAHTFTPAFDPNQEVPDFIETLPSPAPNAEQQLSHRQTLEAVDRALLQLSDTERAILVLFHQEECSYEHIALTLNLPLNTVRTHLHRGRQKLGDLVRAALGSKIHERKSQAKPCIPTPIPATR
jgi:RNA polymerase sigma-70 factor (ECF subfamily)